MAEPRFLLVRLGSMGDVIHALPAASALRDTFPGARIDWLIDPKWKRLLEGNPDLSEIVTLDRKSASGLAGARGQLRNAGYTCAIDFQALYKSAILSWLSGAPKRVGFQSSYAREGLAALFYTDRLNPRGAHKVDHNLTLAQFAGAKNPQPRFPVVIRPEDEQTAAGELAKNGIKEGEPFFILNPGGGWKSKCWPAERYGELHTALAKKLGWRGVVTYGPGEEFLARLAVNSAAAPPPAAILLALGPLMAAMRRARFVVSADTGPLHLTAALGTPVVGLFGPTDPARNGPYAVDRARRAVVRNPSNCETTYQRGADYAPSMLSITAEQVGAAVDRLLERSA